MFGLIAIVIIGVATILLVYALSTVSDAISAVF